jgi:hypothetical protein
VQIDGSASGVLPSGAPGDPAASDPGVVAALSPQAGDQAGSAFGPTGLEPGALVDAIAGSPLATPTGASAAAAATLVGVAAWRFAPVVSSYAGCYVPGALSAAGNAVRGLLSVRLADAGTPVAAAARGALVLGARTSSGALRAASSVIGGAGRLRLPAITGTLPGPGQFSPLQALRTALIALSAALYALAALPGRALRLAGINSVPMTYRFAASLAGLALLIAAAVAGVLA